MLFQWLIYLIVISVLLCLKADDEYPNVSSSEISALQDLFTSTGGDYWKWRKTNDSGPHWFNSKYVNPCKPTEWQGVNCSCTLISCSVTALHLRRYNLTGVVPSLIQLVNLTVIDFSINSIAEFPYSLLDQPGLVYLNMGYNKFAGSIPDDIDLMESIVALRLAGNNMTGTIPESFQYLTTLKDLDLSFNSLQGSFEVLTQITSLENLFLSVNQFTGELPSSIRNLIHLQKLLLFENSFKGTLIDELWSLQNLTELNVARNYLHGPLPDAVRNLTHLSLINLSNNDFNGSFPNVLWEMTKTSLHSIFLNYVGIIGSLDGIFVNQSDSNLKIISLTGNHLTGTIPSITMNLTFLGIDSNYISGTIPESLCSLTALKVLYLNDNQMNGSIPDCIGNLYLFDFILARNEFTGTLPALAAGNVTGGGVYDVSQNLLYGTIPVSICDASAHTFDVSYNGFSGTLPSCLINSIMRIFNVSYNNFDGTLPQNISDAKLITTIAVDHNSLTGPLPDLSGLALLVYYYVQHNRLSGTLPFHATNHTKKRNLHESIAFVDISNNELTGTISSQFFEIASDSLMSFAAASNCFSGSIPDTICNARGLLFLDLDGISTAKSCRRPIFPGSKYLKSFTLANHVNGAIPSCLFSMPRLNTLHLSGNGIGGSFPEDLSLSSTLEYLDLSHNTLTGSIPHQIQRRAWKDLDLSYNKLVGVLDKDIANSSYLTLQVNRISGYIPSSILNLKHINILTGNRFACGTFRSGLPINDYAYANFQCGSNSFNQSVILWTGFAVLALIVVLLAAFPHPRLQNTLVLRLNKYYQLMKMHWHTIMDDEQFASFASFVRTVGRYVLIISAIILLVFLPLDTGLSVNLKTQSYQYAWIVSACYMSGFTPGVVLMIAYIGLICLLFWMWTLMDEQRERYDHSVLKNNYNSIYQSMSLYLVVFFNSIIMIGLNVGYVLAVLYQPSYFIILAQVGIAFFKLYWNEQVVRYLVRISRRFYTHKLSMKSPSFMEVRAAQEMPFLTYMALFNCLIAPFLASAVIDPNCFREVFIPPQSVTSTFPYFDCNVLQVQKGHCNAATSNSSFITVTYDPPFIYSYQCTSSIMTNYAAVYVFMFLITIFIRPFIMWLAVYAYHNLDRNTYLYYWTSMFVNSILKPANLEDLLMNRIIFHKERFVLRYISSTAVLLTFGVLFPPLAVVISGSFFTEQLIFGVLMGRFLNNLSDPVTRGLFKEMLMVDSENCWGLFLNPLGRLVAPFASVFYGLIVFDIYGDTVGSIDAAWMPTLVVATPLILFLGRKLYIYRNTRGGLKTEEERFRESGGKSLSRSGSERRSSNRGSHPKEPVDRSSTFELVDVENPLKSSREVD